jgi:polyisoprenoid-binding protein YceI
MKKIITMMALATMTTATFAQIHFTKTGTIAFKSTTTNTVDKVEATNKSAVCKLNTTTGDLEFGVLIKSFVFVNDLMQQHFNENYMESDKLPKSTFKGKITNLAEVNFAKDGAYKANVEGTLNLHGKSKVVKSLGTIVVKNGKISMNAVVNIPMADYNIAIPSAVKEKISKEIVTTITCNLEPLKK